MLIVTVKGFLGVAELRAGELDDPLPPHPLEQDLHVGLVVQAVDRSILFMLDRQIIFISAII